MTNHCCSALQGTTACRRPTRQGHEPDAVRSSHRSEACRCSVPSSNLWGPLIGLAPTDAKGGGRAPPSPCLAADVVGRWLPPVAAMWKEREAAAAARVRSPPGQITSWFLFNFLALVCYLNLELIGLVYPRIISVAGPLMGSSQGFLLTNKTRTLAS
jgi:hypothetical protein